MSRAEFDLRRLRRWANGADWQPALQLIVDLAISGARHAIDVKGADRERLDAVLGDAGMRGLRTAALESLCANAAPDGRKLSRDYLKRDGRREPAANRAFIKALGKSRLSLHEVSDVVPGEGFVARDVLLGGDPVRVEEPDLSRRVAPWDFVGARILKVGGAARTSPGTMTIGRQDDVPGQFEVLRSKLPELLPKGMGARDVALDCSVMSAWLIARINWIGQMLSLVPGAASGGGEIVKRAYPVKPADMERLSGWLDGSGEFGCVGGEPTWTWRRGDREDAAAPDSPPDFPALLRLAEPGLVVSGREADADAVGGVLERGVGDCLGAPETERGLQGTALAEAIRDIFDSFRRSRPFREAARDIHERITRGLRQVIDGPAEMLGGAVPRELAKRVEGREAVARWLKSVERSVALPLSVPDRPHREYDFGWAWEELDIAELRR